MRRAGVRSIFGLSKGYAHPDLEHQLDPRPPAITDSRYVLLHGVVQHNLYHAGQIAILKKAFQQRPIAKKKEA